MHYYVVSIIYIGKVHRENANTGKRFSQYISVEEGKGAYKRLTGGEKLS
ncbi:hypothetical protein L3073_04820 [Ancylomarina sp. DW003]|nr:hypothetical protein [Ancylomarina sp. DW003]MDE5421519.1 hypothetical protein [Ancylomarina sp. DW003]